MFVIVPTRVEARDHPGLVGLIVVAAITLGGLAVYLFSSPMM